MNLQMCPTAVAAGAGTNVSHDLRFVCQIGCYLLFLLRCFCPDLAAADTTVHAAFADAPPPSISLPLGVGAPPEVAATYQP